MTEALLRLVWALLLTLAAELCMALLLGLRSKTDLLLIAGVNLVTNPALNIALALVRTYAGGAFVPALILLEIAVVFGEFAIYKNGLRFEKIKPLLFSLILNAVSFGTGLAAAAVRATVI